MYLFERQSAEENLDHEPDFKGAVDSLVRDAESVVVIGWRHDTGCALFDWLATTRKKHVTVIEPFLSNVQTFRYDGVRMVYGDACAFMRLLTPAETGDAVFLWQDGPEHVFMDEAYFILGRMKTVAAGIVLATPEGVYSQGVLGGNLYEEHRSTWHMEDYERLGFKVVRYSPGLIGYWRSHMAVI